MSKQALQKAIDLVSGQTELARLLAGHTGRPVSQARVWNWLHRDALVPAEMVIPIETVVGGAVSRHELRPDIYPAEHPAGPPRQVPPQEARKIA